MTIWVIMSPSNSKQKYTLKVHLVNYLFISFVKQLFFVVVWIFFFTRNAPKNQLLKIIVDHGKFYLFSVQ